MTLRDAMAVHLVIAMWAGVFVPMLLEAWRLRCAPNANGVCGIPRDELRARFEPRLRSVLPLYWVAAGIVSGYVSDHPAPVASAILFFRFLFLLAGSAKRQRVGTFLLHVIEFVAGAALAIGLRATVSH